MLDGHPLEPPGRTATTSNRHSSARDAGFRRATSPRQPQPPLLLLVDHLERVAEAVAGLPLDLAEDEPPAAPDDQVEP